MRWSSTLANVAGIDVKVHATFVLVLVWVAVVHWSEDRSLESVILGLAFILALFACVVLHELGHALTARRYGVKTRDIILLPIGGVARLESIPEEPRQEFWIAVAGPAVNVVIAAVLGLWIELTGVWAPIGELTTTGGPFWERLLLVNVFLVVFNLIPAFPMDGGRVLRALLALRMEYVQATQIAANIGQGLAFLFGFLGLLSTNPFLVFIAFFVWIGAAQEASLVQMKAALGGIPVDKLMVIDYQTVAPSDTLADVVQLTLAGSQKDFPVVENGRVVGVLPQDALLKALAAGGESQLVADVMMRDFQRALPSEMIEPVFLRLRGSDCRSIPVLRGDELVGLVTMDNVGEFLRIQSALAK